LDGAGGYKPGKLILIQSREVTEGEWDKFTDLLEQSCYWKMPTEEGNPGGKDGAQWVLEGIKEGRSHVVDRWTPEGGSYRELCLYLLKLSGLKVSEEDLY
jgi:hypothetical protein